MDLCAAASIFQKRTLPCPDYDCDSTLHPDNSEQPLMNLEDIKEVTKIRCHLARLAILSIRIRSDSEMERKISTEMETNGNVNAQNFDVGSGMAWPLVHNFTENMPCAVTRLREFNDDKTKGLVEVVIVHQYSDEINGEIKPQYVRGIKVSV